MPCNDINCPCSGGEAARLAALAETLTTTSPVGRLAAVVAEIAAERSAAAPTAEEPEPPEPRRCPACDGVWDADHEEALCGNCGDQIGCCCDCTECEARGCTGRFRADESYTCANGGGCGSRCGDHCRCTYCESCERYYYDTAFCSNCDRCGGDAAGCCDCCYCDACGNNVYDDAYCGDCERCDSCGCRCDDGNDDGDRDRTPGPTSRPVFRVRPLVFHRGFAHPRFPSLRYAAAEIEVAAAQSGVGAPFDVAATRWSASVVTDGSLPSTGFEINTAPASGDEFVKQIEELCGVLNTYSASVTTKCGLHVHVDGRHLRLEDIAKATLLAVAVEDGMYRVVPSSRRDGSFSRPLPTRFSEVAEHSKLPTPHARFLAIGKMVYMGEMYRAEGATVNDVKSQAASKYNGARYSWWNIHSWFHRRTIEIRTHGGTTNATKIIMWASYWASFVDRVVRMSVDDVHALIAAHPDPWALLLWLAPTAEHVRHLADRRATFDYGYSHLRDPAFDAAIAQFNTNTAATAAQE